MNNAKAAPFSGVADGAPGVRSSSMTTCLASTATHTNPKSVILPLFYTMGGYIPKVLLDRAKSPQKRVGECGEMYEVTLRDTGLHQDLVNVFDATILERSIEGLISHSAIGLQESDSVRSSRG